MATAKGLVIEAELQGLNYTLMRCKMQHMSNSTANCKAGRKLCGLTAVEAAETLIFEGVAYACSEVLVAVSKTVNCRAWRKSSFGAVKTYACMRDLTESKGY